MKVVSETLAEIDVVQKPILFVFNKVDAYKFIEKEADDLTPVTKENHSLDDLKNTWMAKSDSPSIFISATKRINLEELRKLLYDNVKKIHVKRYPYNDFLYADEYP